MTYFKLGKVHRQPLLAGAHDPRRRTKSGVAVRFRHPLQLFLPSVRDPVRASVLLPTRSGEVRIRLQLRREHDVRDRFWLLPLHHLSGVQRPTVSAQHGFLPLSDSYDRFAVFIVFDFELQRMYICHELLFLINEHQSFANLFIAMSTSLVIIVPGSEEQVGLDAARRVGLQRSSAREPLKPRRKRAAREVSIARFARSASDPPLC